LSAIAGVYQPAGEAATGALFSAPSFRDGPKDQTRNLEIPGSVLRTAPE
jgi:hypothetical protein